MWGQRPTRCGNYYGGSSRGSCTLPLSSWQGKTELREYLRKVAARSYVERLSDMHLLLWLSKQPNLDSNDMILLCDAVKDRKPIMEGYRVIIDSIAGM